MSNDALRAALAALECCIEDSAELLRERIVQWGAYKLDKQRQMAAKLEEHRAALATARAALAQRADEPVAWAALLSVMLAQDLAEAKRLAGEALDKPRAAASAAPAYVPLRDDEFESIISANCGDSPTRDDLRDLCRAIEAAHGITAPKEQK